MDNFDLNGFIRDFKAGKNPYGETPQPLTESTTPEPTEETSKETYVNEFLSEVESKLKEFRDDSDEIDDLLADLEDGPDPEDLYGDVTVSHGERKPYRPMMEEEEEDEEEVEVSDEVEVDGEEDMDMDMGEEGGVDDLENHLESALKIARSMGDEKLADQIGNTVTFFTRQYVARDKEGGLDEQKKLNEEYDLDVEFKNTPSQVSYEDALEIIKSWEDMEALDKFKSIFPKGKPVSKKDYYKFSMSYIDDISEIFYIKANWVSIFDEDVFDKSGLI